MFICLDACKKWFLKGCKPFITFDGCSLKGPYGGVLLAIVSLDVNNGLFLMTFVIVKKENKEGWSFFLYHLKSAIGSTSKEKRFTFMSNK